MRAASAERGALTHGRRADKIHRASPDRGRLPHGKLTPEHFTSTRSTLQAPEALYRQRIGNNKLRYIDHIGDEPIWESQCITNRRVMQAYGESTFGK